MTPTAYFVVRPTVLLVVGALPNVPSVQSEAQDVVERLLALDAQLDTTYGATSPRSLL